MPNQPERSRSRLTKQEILTQETEDSKRERLKAFTGIEDELLLQKIYYDFSELLAKFNIEVKQIEGEYNEKKFTSLVFKEITFDEQKEIEGVLDQLGIQGYPDTIPNSNLLDFSIENRWALEILRLMNIFEMAVRREEMKNKKELDEKERLEREEYIKKAVSEAILEMEKNATKEKVILELEERAKKAKDAATAALQKYELEKANERDRENLKREHLRIRVEKYLSQIPKQEVSEEEVEQELRRKSGVDELSGYGNLWKIRQGVTRVKTPRSDFVYDEGEQAEVDKHFAEYQEDWLAGRLEEIDKPEEVAFWNQYIPNLKIFNNEKGGRMFHWQKEGKRKKVLRANQDIDISLLGLKDDFGIPIKKIEQQKVVSKELRESLFIAAKNYNSPDEKVRKVGQLALNITIQINLGLIVSIIKDLKQYSPTKYKNIDGDDLFSLGVIGLISSIDNYDPTKESEIRFHNSFLASYIEGAIRSVNVGDYDFNVKQITYPQSIEELKNKLLKARIIIQRTYPDKKVDEAKVEASLRADGVHFGQKKGGNNPIENNYEEFLRMIHDIYEEFDFKKLGEEIEIQMHDVDMLGNFLYEEPEQITETEQKELARIMGTVLSSLTQREERVLRSRFGIGVKSEFLGLNERGEKVYVIHPQKTLEEIGLVFGVNRERIRQIEAKALRKLKHPSRSRILSAYKDGER